jgi:hypothetical protein
MAPYPSDLSIMEVISTRTGLTVTQIEDVFSHLTVWDVTWAVLDRATRLDAVKQPPLAHDEPTELGSHLLGPRKGPPG